MKLGEFERLVRTSENTLRAAAEANPVLYDAIRNAVPGTESEMDARMEWYLGALQSKKGKAIVNAEFEPKGMSAQDAEKMWAARMSYLNLRSGMDREADPPFLDAIAYDPQMPMVQHLVRARKSALVAFLIQHPDLQPDDFEYEWGLFTNKWAKELESVERKIKLQARIVDPVEDFVRRRIDPLMERIRMRIDARGEPDVQLPSWQKAKNLNEFRDAIMRAFLCEIRNFAPVEICGMDGHQVFDIWRNHAAGLVCAMHASGRSHDTDHNLSDIDLLVLMVGSVTLATEFVVTVALGIDVEGEKRILGFRKGSSDNEKVCADLMSDLSACGLRAPAGRPLLAVLDGARALSASVTNVYPEVLVQRCLIHAEHNLRDYLHGADTQRLEQGFARLRESLNAEDAESAADEIEKFLSERDPQALKYFTEARNELLCTFNLRVPGLSCRELLSTGAIENAFRSLRRYLVLACRDDSEREDCWLASGVILAERGFKRLRGREGLPDLVRALELRGRQANAGFKTNYK